MPQPTTARGFSGTPGRVARTFLCLSTWRWRQIGQRRRSTTRPTRPGGPAPSLPQRSSAHMHTWRSSGHGRLLRATASLASARTTEARLLDKIAVALKLAARRELGCLGCGLGRRRCAVGGLCRRDRLEQAPPVEPAVVRDSRASGVRALGPQAGSPAVHGLERGRTGRSVGPSCPARPAWWVRDGRGGRPWSASR